jgi:hypothetical protein
MCAESTAATDLAAAPRAAGSYRADRPEDSPWAVAPERGWPGWDEWPWRLVMLAAMAAGFVLLWGARVDPGPIESRLGLASHEGLGPLGRVFDAWDPTVWPAQLLPSLAWAWGEGGMPTSATVRWPAAIAGVAAGLILARRASTRLGGRAGVLVGLCWYGSFALIDRSAGLGLDLITGLATVAALDRLLGRGSDLVAGSWAAVAFLAGGWPPVAVVALSTVILGRAGATLSWRLLLPPGLAAAGWSAWALAVMPSEAWAAALALPLTQRMAWWLAPGVLALGLPWTPFATLAASRSVRDGWPAPGRRLVNGWLQVAGVCLLSGTLVPGLAAAARVPALAGLAVASGAVCDRLIASGAIAPAPRRWFLGMALSLTIAWALLVLIAGGYLAAAVGYYRALAVALLVASLPLTILAVRSAAKSDPRGAVLAVLMVAVCLRVAHWGYYAPEWNYRRSQGPWGRAVGQWVPPHWPIYTTHSWPADLAFATGRPVYQLPGERHLAYRPGAVKYVLLLRSEFENWSPHAPAIIPVASFEDEFGSPRVLARTPGELPWTAARPRAASADEED